jgi:hypothetical protein
MELWFGLERVSQICGSRGNFNVHSVSPRPQYELLSDYFALCLEALLLSSCIRLCKLQVSVG